MRLTYAANIKRFSVSILNKLAEVEKIDTET